MNITLVIQIQCKETYVVTKARLSVSMGEILLSVLDALFFSLLFSVQF